MKKTVFLLGLAMLSGSVFAQKADLTSAVLAFRKKEWTSAKKYIDIAQEKISNGASLKAKDLSKFYHHKGLIYLEIYKDESMDDPNALATATEAFRMDVENQGVNKKNSTIYLNQCAGQFNNMAFDAYDAKNFKLALDNFEKVVEIKAYPAINVIDTATVYNMSLMALNGKMYDKAIVYTNRLIELNPTKPEYHNQLITLYNSTGDKEKEFAAIENARKTVPTDINVIYSLVNYYLAEGNNEALKSSLLAAIEQDPKNSTLYFVLGNAYSGLNETDNAKEAYLKAIEIDPGNFDAYNNLASFFLAEAAKVSEEMNKLDFSAAAKKKYAALEKKRNELYESAIPYLSKAVELNPEGVDVMKALREVYYQLDNTEGYKKINDEIKKLEGQGQ